MVEISVTFWEALETIMATYVVVPRLGPVCDL